MKLHMLIAVIAVIFIQSATAQSADWEFLKLTADDDSLHLKENYRFTAHYRYNGTDSLTQDSSHTFRWTAKGNGFPATYSIESAPGDTVKLKSPEFRFDQGDEAEICISVQVNDTAQESPNCRTFPLIEPVSVNPRFNFENELEISRSGNVFTLNNKTTVNWKLYDLSGRLLLSRNTAELHIPPHRYSGIFIIRAETETRNVITEKIHLR